MIDGSDDNMLTCWSKLVQSGHVFLVNTLVEAINMESILGVVWRHSSTTNVSMSSCVHCDFRTRHRSSAKLASSQSHPVEAKKIHLSIENLKNLVLHRHH